MKFIKLGKILAGEDYIRDVGPADHTVDGSKDPPEKLYLIQCNLVQPEDKFFLSKYTDGQPFTEKQRDDELKSIEKRMNS